MTRTGAIVLALAAAASTPLRAQESVPVIDTIIIHTADVFTPQEMEGKGFFRFLNSIHIITRENVIRDELLFREGDPFDETVFRETARNLRKREIFKRVDIDTTRIDGKFAVIVDTQDGQSLKPNFSFSVATDGSWTGRLGVTESNLLGTGALASIVYVKEIERHGPQLAANFRRLFGSQIRAKGIVSLWNDGTDGWWRLGDPFYSNEDRYSVEYDGEASGRRVLEYRIDSTGFRDTTFYRRDALINRFMGVTAPIAESKRYLRLGLDAWLRQEKFILLQDSGQSVPDSLYAAFGLWAELKSARFQTVRYFNGFINEDIDQSPRVKLFVNLAPANLGYERTGIVPGLDASYGTGGARSFFVVNLKAHGLFTDAGLDSGRVEANLTLGTLIARRHSTAIYILAGVQENPPAGQQFSLGFNTPPRSWEANSFVGTRALWGTLEHRWFAVDDFLKLFAVGLAAFVDYGGAWYPDQKPRFGGDFGIGLRMGSALGTVARTGRIDLGYRFGQGSDVGSRLVLSIGGSFVFPWNPKATDLVQREGA
jgi:hypothetical protein